MQRNPSHFGSNSQPSPWGKTSAALHSIGDNGGFNGNVIPPTLTVGQRLMDARCCQSSTAVQSRCWKASRAYTRVY
jgi:hypothetical protein